MVYFRKYICQECIIQTVDAAFQLKDAQSNQCIVYTHQILQLKGIGYHMSGSVIIDILTHWSEMSAKSLITYTYK